MQQINPNSKLKSASTHFMGVFEWAGGIGAEGFGVVGEAEAGLFDPVGGEGVEFVGG